MGYSATINSKFKFSIGANQTILTASHLAGLPIPYSCRTGRCSACKCKVISGNTRALQEEFSLSKTDKQAGWILSCVRTADTDLVIEADELSDIELPPSLITPCRIDSIHRLGDNVVCVTLRLPPNTDFFYIPGQYINVIGTGGVCRSYSIANSSFADKKLELHIRALEGGIMSDYWFNHAKNNDLLRLTGPHGTFFLRDVNGFDLFFLATGTGIAPIKAMLETINNIPSSQQPKSITVLWGGRKKEDLYFDIRAIGSNFNFVPVLSRSDMNWIGATGYVQQHLLTIKPDLKNSVVYACGSNSMIQNAKYLLTQEGLPNNRFYADAFVCSGSN